MILFIGTEERGYFIEEASHMEVKFSGVGVTMMCDR